MKVRTFKVLNSKGDIELIYLKPHYGMEQYEVQNVNDYDENIFDINIFKLYEEKQQLISFLEDKIKNYEESIENSKPYLERKELFNQVQNDIHTDKCIIRNLQEVLDFVNKGGKDE